MMDSEQYLAALVRNKDITLAHIFASLFVTRLPPSSSPQHETEVKVEYWKERYVGK